MILSCYFLFCLLFATFFFFFFPRKAVSWRELLTFQESRAGPSGGHFRGAVGVWLPSAVCQRRRGRGGKEMETEERKDQTVFDQRGVLSHTGMRWRERCFATGGEGPERKTKRQTKQKFFLSKAPAAVVLLQGVSHRANTCAGTCAQSLNNLSAVCLRGSVSEPECNRR